MLGINGGELLIILLVAMVVVGPERMPEYAQRFRQWVVRSRDYVKKGQETVTREMGDHVDWEKLDPRQYDPRRIVREALAEEEAPTPPHRRAAPAPTASVPDGTPAPFDIDAT